MANRDAPGVRPATYRTNRGLNGRNPARCGAPPDTTLSVPRQQDTRRATSHVGKENVMEKKDAISWFEIPATDLGRAMRFYEVVLGIEMKREQMGPQEMAVFSYQAPGVGGCIAQGEGFQPSQQGNLVYLFAGPNMKSVLGRVERGGGKIALGRTELPDNLGCYAHIIDTEGNKVGLHALA